MDCIDLISLTRHQIVNPKEGIDFHFLERFVTALIGRPRYDLPGALLPDLGILEARLVCIRCFRNTNVKRVNYLNIESLKTHLASK